MAEDRVAAAATEEELGRRAEAGDTAEAAPGAAANGDAADDAVAITAELQEMDNQLRRALADLDNVQKRFSREVQRERMAERQRVTREWLPIVDNLELALEHASGEVDPVVEGVRVVLDQATGVLARLGYPRFLDVGERFDPRRHEAVGSVDADAPAGTVVATVRPGYGTAEEVLRPASVLVAKGG